MDADDVLAKVRAGGGQPANWVVFPLLRSKIMMGILNWIGGVIMGGGLLVFVVPIVIPGNYEHGLVASTVTTVMLCIITFMFVGSLILLACDIRRLREIEKHIIVITDEDFVKQEGTKVIQVPLSHVCYVTARGRAPIESNRSADTKGRDTSLKTRRRRTPTSLAFIDARTEQEIIVVNDGVYGDPFLIAAVLKERVAAVNRHKA